MSSKQHQQKVSLITDIDALVDELVTEPVWMVRPKLSRKYAGQRVVMTAEVVDLASINLAKVHTFETV